MKTCNLHTNIGLKEVTNRLAGIMNTFIYKARFIRFQGDISYFGYKQKHFFRRYLVF